MLKFRRTKRRPALGQSTHAAVAYKIHPSSPVAVVKEREYWSRATRKPSGCQAWRFVHANTQWMQNSVHGKSIEQPQPVLPCAIFIAILECRVLHLGASRETAYVSG